ncbi:hypothetical protein COOONC_23306 [Cooperia oncophora]
MTLPSAIVRNTRQLIHLHALRCVSNSPAANEPPQKFDIAVVGGGIVGSATARQLKMEYPQLKICLLEKENKLCE